MSSLQDARSSPSSFPADLPADPAPVESPLSPAPQLAQASRALWVATLSLMAAYMQNPAPAHRLLLARRIARNFDTLGRQECFAPGCRATFARLARRWQARAEQLTPEGPAPRRGWFARLFPARY
ncbi:hypothetical protein GCM10028796_36610 [Ramlibacter monticola]|uniref:Uncharacterized protein n=1 Tax=Ramlibacter monticola TaxID=1926872 RepID=A0A937CWA2_9BURK|nr:hypothetical protein [Ramlibacter monticola]MBL0394548.1 hypothetical protein [Ramlibacter monticola]